MQLSGSASFQTLRGRVLLPRERIIEIARRGREGEPEILQVLEVAKETDDRHLLGICLDCFRSVLEDSTSEATEEVVMWLGQRLMDRAYRRIRPRMLRALASIGRGAYPVLPEIVATYLKGGHGALRVSAYHAVCSVAWQSLAAGGPAERAGAVEAFERIGGRGLLNLRAFLKHETPDTTTRSMIEGAIERLQERRPGY